MDVEMNGELFMTRGRHRRNPGVSTSLVGAKQNLWIQDNGNGDRCHIVTWLRSHGTARQYTAAAPAENGWRTIALDGVSSWTRRRVSDPGCMTGKRIGIVNKRNGRNPDSYSASVPWRSSTYWVKMGLLPLIGIHIYAFWSTSSSDGAPRFFCFAPFCKSFRGRPSKTFSTLTIPPTLESILLCPVRDLHQERRQLFFVNCFRLIGTISVEEGHA